MTEPTTAAGRHREPPLRHAVWEAFGRAAPQVNDAGAVLLLLLFVVVACYSATQERAIGPLIGDVSRAVILLWIAARFALRAWQVHGFEELRDD